LDLLVGLLGLPLGLLLGLAWLDLACLDLAWPDLDWLDLMETVVLIVEVVVMVCRLMMTMKLVVCCGVMMPRSL